MMEIRNITSADTQMTMSTDKLKKTEQIGEENIKSNNSNEKAEAQKADNMSDSIYSSVSKDGDTLELSDEKKSNNDTQTRIVIKEGKRSVNPVKMTDASLAKCSSFKLKQLLQQDKISKQQYDKAIKNH